MEKKKYTNIKQPLGPGGGGARCSAQETRLDDGSAVPALRESVFRLLVRGLIKRPIQQRHIVVAGIF